MAQVTFDLPDGFDAHITLIGKLPVGFTPAISDVLTPPGPPQTDAAPEILKTDTPTLTLDPIRAAEVYNDARKRAGFPNDGDIS